MLPIGTSHSEDEAMSRRVYRSWLHLAGLVFTFACSYSNEDPQSWRVSGSQTALLDASSDDSVLVIVLAPADCFACNSVYANFLELRERGELRTLLLLARQPSPRDDSLLVLARVRWDGIVTKPSLRRSLVTPRVLLVRGDSILRDETLAPGDESHIMQELLMSTRTPVPYRSSDVSPPNPPSEGK